MNLWCVGRNYAEHAHELGNEVPEEPLIFLKAGSCLTFGSEVVLPSWTQEVHHEIEIAFQFGAQGQFRNVALAVDLTERKIQSEAKKKGTPWTLAKSFQRACPISPSIPFGQLETQDWRSWELSLEVNGVLRQKGRGGQMIHSIEKLSHYVQNHFPVQENDWLLTGTPAGVGALSAGDQLTARWGSLIVHHWTVQKPH